MKACNCYKCGRHIGRDNNNNLSIWGTVFSWCYKCWFSFPA